MPHDERWSILKTGTEENNSSLLWLPLSEPPAAGRRFPANGLKGRYGGIFRPAGMEREFRIIAATMRD